MNAIEVQELGKSYDGVAAVDGLSMTIGEGEIFALLGPNMAAKIEIDELMAINRA